MKSLPSGEDSWERKAPRPARSTVAIPSRVSCRTPADSRASVRRSERTTSQEDRCISLTSDRPARAPTPSTGKRKMKAWTEITHYAGFDWGHNRHQVVIVDQQGQIVTDFAIEHRAAGWRRWGEQVAALGGAVAACVETSQGMVIEQLLESGVSLYPIAPRSAKVYRERKRPVGRRATIWMPGVWPMRCGSMAMAGERSAKKTRWWPSCGCFAATRWPSSRNAPLWSTNSRVLCKNIIRPLSKPSRTGRCRQPGPF